MTPKVVMFSMDVGDAPQEFDKSDGETSLPLNVSILYSHYRSW